MATINLGKVVPAKGIDYFTNEDKTIISNKVSQLVSPTLAQKEEYSNKTGILNDESTFVQYPTAKATYDLFAAKDELIAELEEENEKLLNQIPTTNVTTTNGIANVQDSSKLPLANFEMIGNATQADTPTPETPQDIHVVTGDNTIMLYSNLIPTQTSAWEQGSINGNTGIDTSSTSRLRTKDFFRIEKGNYYISVADNYRWLNIIYYDENKNYITSQYNVDTIDGLKEKAISITDDRIKYARATVKKSSNSTIVVDDIVETRPMVEAGSNKTSFTPYQPPQTLPLNLGSKKLAKIGDYADRIYKDNGKWYVEKNIYKTTADGTEYWQRTARTSGAVYWATCSNWGIPKAKMGVSFGKYCNYFKYEYAGWSNITIDHFGENSLNNPDAPAFVFYPNGINTLQDWKDWVSTHNLIIYYPLVTPTTTEITDTDLISQLEAILNASTYKNTTNFAITPSGTNATGDLEVEYRIDIETVLNTLEARVELLEE